MTVRLSTTLVTFAAEDPGGWDHVMDHAAMLDECGVDRLVVSDHVVFGERLDAYGRPELGGTAGGRQPTGPDGHWLEPLTVLAVVAGRTRTIRLGTNILLAALRRPAVLAKTAATLDVLSGGRLDLGVGVGWQREEYDAAGLDFGARGRLLDHSLEVCSTLWRDQVASVVSDDLSFDGIHMMPKPLQPGGVPIWVSGTINPRVVQRIVRFGSGWIPWGVDAVDPATSIPRMKKAVTDTGGDGAALEVVAQLPLVKTDTGLVDIDATLAPVPRLVESGATDLRTMLRPGDNDPVLVRDLVAAFRAAVGRT